MKSLKQGLLLGVFLLSGTGFACTSDGKEGFLPENDLNIPITFSRTGGLTEDQFNAVIDKIEALYAPIVSQEGARLRVVRRWADGTVNAYAEQMGTTWKVSMFGGLARHSTITEDGFALVLCH